jgi:ATP-binding cassette subfamily F protein 3
MSLLSFADVGVSFGATVILENVTFTVDEGERWGIVGRNGAGKTTIFNLITGALTPTRGAIAKTPRLRVAELDQHRNFEGAVTVWDAAASEYGEIIALEAALARQGEHLAELGEKVTEADLERYGRDQERFAHGGGYEFHARVDAVLQGLGFDAEESKHRPIGVLSGGERGRVGLAAQLAAPADLVLLDEPTNHLDLDTIDWLKAYLGEFGETVLVISHDRAFLDDTVDHVLHVANRTTTAYRGGYSSFVRQREEQRIAQERAATQQKKVIAREEDYIRRNLAGRNSSQAKGRRSRLERLPRLSPPPGEAGALTLRLEITERGGDQTVVADKMDLMVGERVLARGVSLVARRNDVIALTGPNGAGKSTLIATLLGARAPAAGEARLGNSITPAWFRQDLAQVPLNKTIYDCIADLRPEWNRGAIQNHLGAFGFSGDEVLRNTGVISGGERARVALSLIALSGANLLILDEPTNHLDVESIEAIEDALEDYEGTTIIVSHDRAFLRELATRVWAFDGTRIEDYPGTFVEWELHAATRAVRRQKEASALAATERERERGRRSADPARDGKKKEDAERRTRQREVEALEQAVQEAESRIAGIEHDLAEPTLYDSGAIGARRATELTLELDKARKVRDQALARWTELASTLEG